MNMTPKQLAEYVYHRIENWADEERSEFISELSKKVCTLCGTTDLPCFCDPRYDIL